MKMFYNPNGGPYCVIQILPSMSQVPPDLTDNQLANCPSHGSTLQLPLPLAFFLIHDAMMSFSVHIFCAGSSWDQMARRKGRADDKRPDKTKDRRTSKSVEDCENAPAQSRGCICDLRLWAVNGSSDWRASQVSLSSAGNPAVMTTSLAALEEPLYIEVLE